MIGVREEARGEGLGRALIDEVHRMSREDPASEGITLTTELPANLPLYRHLGYEIIGHVEFGEGVETWGFFRPD
jgi:GNAT superfamily N-acetyltransferase